MDLGVNVVEYKKGKAPGPTDNWVEPCPLMLMDGIDGELSSLVHIRPWRHPSHARTARLETSSQQKKGLARRFENTIVQSTVQWW